MSFKKFHPFTLGCVLAILMSMAPAVLGQVANPQAPTQAPEYSRFVRFPVAQK